MSEHNVMKLKAIVYNCDFRQTDATLYERFRNSPKYQGELRAGEVYLFVSGCENQLTWFLNQTHGETKRGRAMTFTDSRRWRFSTQTHWDPLMLQEYAQAAGIVLKGIRSFKRAFEEQRENKREIYRARKEASRRDAAKVERAG